jgi:hypothetical protein
MSWPADSGEPIAVTSTKNLVNGDTLFNVFGDIQIVSLVSECIATGTPAASTLQYQAAPAVGAAATFSGASASMISCVAGSSIQMADGMTTAPIIEISGANNAGTYPLAAFCPEGAIKAVVGSGPTSGTWRHYIRYKPLEPGAYVTGV